MTQTDTSPTPSPSTHASGTPPTPAKPAPASGDVPAKARTGAGDAQKVVILHDGVGGAPMYTRGQVVDGSVFPDLDRLKELGAVEDYVEVEVTETKEEASA